MGWIAKMSHEGSRQSFNGIPSNWLIVLASGFIGAMFLGFARDGNAWALVLVIPCCLVALAFLLSILKRDTFFIREPLPATVPSGSVEAALQTKLRWTGRLRLHEKCAQRFIDMPVDATRLDDGSLALISRIDASTRFYSEVTESKVGIWLAIPQPESFEMAPGTLFYGSTGAPALELRFVDGSDGQKSRAIVSFESIQDRGVVLSWLEAEKEKAARSVAPLGTSGVQPNLAAKTNSPFNNSTSGF